MTKKSVIPFAKKKQDTEKTQQFCQKKRAKTPQNRGCETVLWGFCHKNGDEKFLKANNYENGEKIPPTQYNIAQKQKYVKY